MKTNSYQPLKKKKLNFSIHFVHTICKATHIIESKYIALPQNLPHLINKSFNSLKVSCSDIAKIISYFDPNKAHGHELV